MSKVGFGDTREMTSQASKGLKGREGEVCGLQESHALWRGGKGGAGPEPSGLPRLPWGLWSLSLEQQGP